LGELVVKKEEGGEYLHAPSEGPVQRSVGYKKKGERKKGRKGRLHATLRRGAYTLLTVVGLEGKRIARTEKV